MQSFGYAARGIRVLFMQPNACIHLVAVVLVNLAGVYYAISTTEWCFVWLCIGGVLMAEGFNTAIEVLADRVNPEFDVAVGRCKDIAAGAVLLMVIAAVIVGSIIFLPKIFCLNNV